MEYSDRLLNCQPLVLSKNIAKLNSSLQIMSSKIPITQSCYKEPKQFLARAVLLMPENIGTK